MHTADNAPDVLVTALDIDGVRQRLDTPLLSSALGSVAGASLTPCPSDSPITLTLANRGDREQSWSATAVGVHENWKLGRKNGGAA